MTAVTLAHYSWHSLSKAAQLASKISFVSLSDAAEGFAFAYVGLSLWDVTKGPLHIEFALYMLFIVMCSRFLTIIGLGYIYHWFKNSLFNRNMSLLNRFRLRNNIVYNSIDYPNDIKQKSFNYPIYEQLAFTLGGVIRGCLCWAQVLQIGDNRLFIQTTVIIIMVTTIGLGGILPIVIPILTDLMKESEINSGNSHNASAESLIEGVTSKAAPRNGNHNSRSIAGLGYLNSNSLSKNRFVSLSSIGNYSNPSEYYQLNSNSSLLMDEDNLSTFSQHLDGSVADSDETDSNFGITEAVGDKSDDELENSDLVNTEPISHTNIRAHAHHHNKHNITHFGDKGNASLTHKESSRSIINVRNFNNKNRNDGQDLKHGDSEDNSISPCDPQRYSNQFKLQQQFINLKKSQQYSLLYLLWLRVDEEYMKPVFGKIYLSLLFAY